MGACVQASHESALTPNFARVCWPALSAGESYAGVYVPNLAHSVVKGNDDGHKPHINLKARGFS
jgi:carboxypeptidase C (cathepsin A)